MNQIDKISETGISYISSAFESIQRDNSKDIFTYCTILINICDNTKKMILTLINTSHEAFGNYNKVVVNDLIKINNAIVEQLNLLNKQLNSIGIKDKNFSDLKTEYDNLSIKYKVNRERMNQINSSIFYVTPEFKEQYSKLNLLSVEEISSLLSSFDFTYQRIVTERSVSLLSALTNPGISEIKSVCSYLSGIYKNNDTVIKEMKSENSDNTSNTESLTIDVKKDMKQLYQIYFDLHKKIIKVLDVYRCYKWSGSKINVFKLVTIYTTLFLSVGKIINQRCNVIMKLV